MSHCVAFLLAGGDGVDLNICFNALAATVVIFGIALCDIRSESGSIRSNVPSALLSAAVMAALFVGVLIHVPGQLQDNYDRGRVLRARESEFRSAIQFLKARSDRALCESFLLCYEAGKPLEFDPLYVKDQIRIDRLDENEITQLLRTHYFQTVQVTIGPSEASQESGLLVKERRRFTRTFMLELVENYRVAISSSQMVIFIPK
jgi:hypothetical protein